MPFQDESSARQPHSGIGRGCAVVIALILGLTAAGLYWIERSFPLKGGGWFEFIAAIFVEEFIAAVALFAFALLLSVVVPPAWIPRWLATAAGHATQKIFALGCLLAAAALIVPLVFAVLVVLGILK